MNDTLLALATQLKTVLAANATLADATCQMPAADISALAESRYLAAPIPTEHGGWGANLADTVRTHLLLAQGSGSTALMAAMTLQIFGYESEARLWSPAHYAEFCQAVLRGALFNSIASEPQMGSPSHGGLPATVLLPQPDPTQGWLLHGRKTWATGGAYLTHMLVRARLGDEGCLVLVRQHDPGVSWLRTWGDGLSLRASESHDVLFEAVPIAHDRLVVAQVARTLPNVWFPMLVTSTYLGVALAARDAVIRYALERVPTALGKPIATLPSVQRQIGELDLSLQAAQTFLLHVAEQWQPEKARQHSYYTQVIAAKHLAIETALQVTDKTLRIAGAASIGNTLPLERYFRDVRAGLMHPPNAELALEQIGQAALTASSGGAL